jgi:hypothetical protein
VPTLLLYALMPSDAAHQATGPRSLPKSLLKPTSQQLTCQLDICKRVTPPYPSPCAREVAICRISLHKCLICMWRVCADVLQA